MLESISENPLTQLICCDAQPDSRRKLTEKLIGFGYPVLATGNPQIASGLIQEQGFGALVVSMEKMKLSMISVVVDARRVRPNLPIVIIFNEAGTEAIPPGLADLVLVKPTDRKLKESLRAFTEKRTAIPLACSPLLTAEALP
ncbi:MAG: hypothetical protein HY711_08700 [Candidatus Melainabacteria bacterium]|nr:hypothetical protein [Candidatus Melainabacteria bacterium]